MVSDTIFVLKTHDKKHSRNPQSSPPQRKILPRC